MYMQKGFFLKIAVLVLIGIGFSSQAKGALPITINGAGATFPYPVYSQWAYMYQKETGMKLNYQSIGSGGGIAQIKAKTVDFGASDAPMKPQELNKYGLIQFPMVVGGVVPVINVPGVRAGRIRMTPKILADIFLGDITRWNDKAILNINHEVKLPSRKITVVHRADGSGTTWIFTNYLSEVSKEWRKKVGFGKAVSWPAGIGGKGNEGVAAYVQRIKGAIGYVEFAYALQNKMRYVLLQNRSGKFVAPTIKSFQAAASSAEWKNAPGYYMVLTNQEGQGTWPITGASFILIYKEQQSCERAKAMLKFFDWCYRYGGGIAEKLEYVPIPLDVVDLMENTWKNEVTCNRKPVWGN